MEAQFNRFYIRLTLDQAEPAAHQGQCDDDVSALLQVPAVARNIAAIDPDDIRAELREYGAWDDAELADDSANAARIVWIAAGNIVDEQVSQ